MNVTHVYSRNQGVSAAKEIVGKLDDTDPGLLLLFPTTAEISSHGFEDALESFDREYDCPIVGSSVGGFATEQTDGFELFGTCAVAIEDISFTAERVQDVWKTGVEYNKNLLEHDKTTLLFGPGSRAGSNTAAWRTAKQLANRLLSNSTLRQPMIRKISSILEQNSIGYSSMFYARVQAGLEGKAVVNFDSSDGGDFMDGYEIYNDELTDSQSATVLSLDHDLPVGTAQTAEESLDSEDVTETFEELETHNNIIYLFDGETLADIKERYAIGRTVGRGAFSYYTVLETQAGTFAVPIPDLNILVSYAPIHDDTTAHLLHAPAFEDYMAAYKDMLDELDSFSGTPHISINPPQMNHFRNQLTRITETADEHLDSYIITIENALRHPTSVEYNYPGYVIYQ